MLHRPKESVFSSRMRKVLSLCGALQQGRRHQAGVADKVTEELDERHRPASREPHPETGGLQVEDASFKWASSWRLWVLVARLSRCDSRSNAWFDGQALG